jgi:UDP-galactopyranose mutase
LPEQSLISHRIINTGSFSKTNSSENLLERGLTTCVVEASGYVSESDLKEDALRACGATEVLNYSYRDATYVIQEASTKAAIEQVKRVLEPKRLYLTGRFAEWEYYNMDTAIYAALQLCESVSRQFD